MFYLFTFLKFSSKIISLLCRQRLHGFNNNISIANELLASGFYLSFGKALFNPSMESVFSKIPSDKIFLETDDSDYEIEDIYKKAAQIKNTSIEQLSLQIMQNSKTVFKTNFN